ncbi:MAG: GNAT family N-acetyltransferase [Actinobacteria bacterium]|nr:GNAT family N-acetyltransferase [Actinomycetota bacterium]
MTESAPLTLRRAAERDRAAILDLLRVSLGREVDDRYDALFAWKHEENAFGPSPAWVACDGDRLAGFRTLMRWEFVDPEHPATTVRAVRAVDTATHPDYQGRGIFTRLTLHALDELATEGVDLVFNTPNDQSRPGYLKMGWQVVGKVPTVVRPAHWYRLGRIAKARVPAERWSTPSDAGRPAAEVLADAAGLAELLDAQATRPGLHTRLRPDVLQWRFGTPLLGYRALVAPGGAREGLAIFRIRQRGTACEAALVALLTRAGDRRTAGRLVRAVAREAEADYVLALGGPAWWPGGLVRLPRVGPILTCKPIGTKGSPSRWDLTLGDIELF